MNLKKFLLKLGVSISIVGIGGFTPSNINIFNFTVQNVAQEQISFQEDYYVKLHKTDKGGYKDKFVIELRPQQRTWYPFYIGILREEKKQVKCKTKFAPAGKISLLSESFVRESSSSNHIWWFNIGGAQSSPTQSYYISCDKLPSIISFGETDSIKNYCIDFIDETTWQECSKIQGKLELSVELSVLF